MEHRREDNKKNVEPYKRASSQCKSWEVIELRDGWWLCHTLPDRMKKKHKMNRRASSNQMSNCWPTKEWSELKDGNRHWMVCTITTFYRCVACLNLIYLCLDTNVDPVSTGLRRFFFVFGSCFNFFVFHLSWTEDSVNCDMYLLVVEEDNRHLFFLVVSELVT